MQPCVSNKMSIDLFQMSRLKRREHHLDKLKSLLLKVLCQLHAIAGISDRIELTGSLLFSEKRDFISDKMKSINGIVILLLKYSDADSAGTFDLLI